MSVWSLKEIAPGYTVFVVMGTNTSDFCSGHSAATASAVIILWGWKSSGEAKH